MEGLAGTAIRPAVRVPSCPQAPVLGRAHSSAVLRGPPAGGSGHDHLAGQTREIRHPGWRVNISRGAAGTGARISFQGSGPCRTLRTTGARQPPQPGNREPARIPFPVPACTPLAVRAPNVKLPARYSVASFGVARRHLNRTADRFRPRSHSHVLRTHICPGHCPVARRKVPPKCPRSTKRSSDKCSNNRHNLEPPYGIEP